MAVKIKKKDKKELLELVKKFQETKSGRESVKIAEQIEQKATQIKSKS